MHGGASADPKAATEQARRLRCPVLVIHGDRDAVRPHATGARLAELSGGTMVTIEGGGHAPHVGDPVKVNLLLRDFVKPAPPPKRWVRGRSRRKRALYISSPIGLGHAQRDAAIANELRKLHPDLEIDWLAQHPVTTVLEAHGERIHPASTLLANESSHIESESAEHDLHAFQAIRRMDEILLSNFMVFHDLAREEPYDLWIGDEAWELDYYLHENPEHKHAAYVWMTDFVGWLPMPGGGRPEAALTADYNAEMIEHIARFPRVRDRAVFVGNPDDIVPDTFGPDLPAIGDWTREHYAFAGYITGFDPAEVADPPGAARRARLPGRRAGLHRHRGRLRRRRGAAAAGDPGVPDAKRRVPALRMIVVAGPRIDPASLPTHQGLEVHAFVPKLYRHLAACDLAVVQGGLSTCMELAANRRPFLYFPLANHFEQNFHVAHRLDRYRAGRRMDYHRSDPRPDRRGDRRRARPGGGLPAGGDRRRRPRRRPARRAAVTVSGGSMECSAMSISTDIQEENPPQSREVVEGSSSRGNNSSYSRIRALVAICRLLTTIVPAREAAPPTMAPTTPASRLVQVSLILVLADWHPLLPGAGVSWELVL
jgi:hypothetical protein